MGVHFDNQKKRWRVRFYKDGKQHHIGMFKTELAGKRALNKAKRQMEIGPKSDYVYRGGKLDGIFSGGVSTLVDDSQISDVPEPAKKQLTWRERFRIVGQP